MKPVVISFYSGSAYYRQAAATLKADCDRAALDSDIVELDIDAQSDWIDICRRKIPFIAQMHRKHQRPVLWLDVDSRIEGALAMFDGAGCDFAAFLRGIRYLRGFDAQTSPRQFAPFALYFGWTPAACAFVELMSTLERQSDVKATDDYFLQEAWTQHQHELAVMVLPPRLVGRQWPLTDEQRIYVGISGNVSSFRAQAAQHTVPVQAPERQRAVLAYAADEALAEGQAGDALVLLQRALKLGERDDRLALKIARVTRSHRGVRPAVDFLRHYQGSAAAADLAQRFLVDSAIGAGDLRTAERALRPLLAAAAERDWARSRCARISLDRRGAKRDAKRRVAIEWPDEDRVRHFDDLIGIRLIERLTGAAPRVVPRGKGLLPVGGALSSAASGTIIWGSGLDASGRTPSGADYRAVRSPATRDEVLRAGGQCPPAYGDPLWLWPSLRPRPRGAPRHRLALACDDRIAGTLRVDADVLRIGLACDELDAVDQILDQLASCEGVLTSSPAVLTLCLAYGIPAQGVVVAQSDASVAAQKAALQEVYATAGLDAVAAVQLAPGDGVGRALASTLQVAATRPDLSAVIDAAPFPMPMLKGH